MQQVSNYGLELMKIIRENGNRALYAEVVEGLGVRGKSWTENTITTLLSRLMEKGFLKSNKIGWEDEHVVVVMEEDYQAAQTETLLHKLYQGGAKGLVCMLIERKVLSPEDYEELKQLWGSRGAGHN